MSGGAPALFETGPAPSVSVRPACRIYAGMMLLPQFALAAAMLNKGGTTSPFPLGLIALTVLGLLLLACNQPIGRSVFIPAAILQIIVLGLAGIFGLLALLAAWIQQSGTAAGQAAIHTSLAGGNAMLLLTGVPLVASCVRRDGGS